MTSLPFELTSDFTGKVYAFLQRRDQAVQAARGQVIFLAPPHHRDYLIAYEAKVRVETDRDRAWLQSELARAAMQDKIERLVHLRAEVETAETDEARHALVEEAERLVRGIHELRAALGV